MRNRLKESGHSVLTQAMQALAIASVLALGVPSTLAAPATGKISKDLLLVRSGSTADVIVQFRNAPGDSEIAGITARGAKLKRTLRNVRAAVFSVPASALAALSNNPEVVYVSPDREVAGRMEFAGPAVGADHAFNSGWTGSGIGIAIIDSGINPEHPDIKGRIAYSESFIAGDTRTDDPYGHGTHVAVVAAGNAAASTGPSFTLTFRGIAPRSHLINLRVLNANGEGSDAAVIAAIDRAIALKDVHAIRVLNLSLGRTIRESYTLDPLCRAVERAWRAGLVVVVAAGNNGRDNSMGTSGYGSISSPANSPHVITVGAMKDMGTVSRADDLMASYSSKGPTLLDQIVKPDLVAPGSFIVSGVTWDAMIRTRHPENVVPVMYYKVSSTSNTSTVYFRLSGTSMAAPIVAGGAALLLQKNPMLTPDQVKTRLMKTATKTFPESSVNMDPLTGATHTVTYDLFTVGAGYLDLRAALENTDLSAGAATSPRAVYDPADGNTSVMFEPGSAWDNAVIWGTAVVWGTNVIVNGDAVVWGTAVIWGTQLNGGFAVIWGSNSVWGSSQPFLEPVSIYGER
jgi:serine protease AprX